MPEDELLNTDALSGTGTENANEAFGMIPLLGDFASKSWDIYAAKRNYDFQKNMRETNYQLNASMAQMDLFATYEALLRQRNQTREILAHEVGQNYELMRMALGRTATAAAAGGVSGNTVGALLQSQARTALRRNEELYRQQFFYESQLRYAANAARRQNLVRLRQAMGPAIMSPNYFHLGLQAAKSFVNMVTGMSGGPVGATPSAVESMGGGNALGQSGLPDFGFGSGTEMAGGEVFGGMA